MPRVRARQNHQTEAPPPPEEIRPEPERYLSDGFPNPKAMSVWDYQQELSQEQWKEHIGYLYRTSPTTMRVQGKTAFLLKFASPITEEQIAEQYGGRAYTLILKRGKEKAYEERFGIEAPPKFQDGETPEATAAEKEKSITSEEMTGATKELLAKFVDDVMRQRDLAQQQGKAFDPQTAIKNALEFQGRGYEAAMNLVVEQAKRAQMVGGGDSSTNQLLALILPKLVDKIFSPAPDPFAQIDNIMGVIEKLRGENTGGGGGEGSVWTELARSVGPHLGEMIANLRGTVGDFRAAQEAQTARLMLSKGYQVRTPPGAAPLPGTAGGIPPIPPVTSGSPSSGSPLPGPVLVQTAPTPAEPPDNQAIALFMQDFIKSRIVKFLKDGDSGEEAAGWADDTDPLFAEQLARVIQENPAALSNDAIFSQVIQHPNLRQFTEDYVAYFEKEPEPEPASVGESTG